MKNELPCYKPDKTDLSQSKFYILSEEEKKKNRKGRQLFDEYVPKQR